MSGPARLRTYSLPELLDGIFKLYRANFELFASISLVLALPDILFYAAGLSRYSALLRLALAPYLLATLYLAIAHVIFRGPANAIDVLMDGARCYPSYFGLYRRLIVAVLALIIPPLGIWLLVRWAPASSVLASEPVEPRVAIKRSAQLVEGYWWRTFGMMLSIGLLQAVLSVVLASSAAIIMVLVPGMDLASKGTAIDILAKILAAFVVPIVPIGFTLIYVDLNVRKQGIDLEPLARSAAEAA